MPTDVVKKQDVEEGEMKALLQNYLAKRYDQERKAIENIRKKEGSTMEKVFKDFIDLNRIWMISDGVLAVVLTLLVLDLHGK